MTPVTMALRKRPVSKMTQLQLRKAKRTAPWEKKLKAIMSAGAATFAARRAYKSKNNVFSYPLGVRNLQRRLNVAKTRTKNNENRRRMKIEGFKVSRFYLQTINAARGNATFDNAGYVQTIQTNMVDDSSVINTSTVAYNNIPLSITSYETFTFCPQWPGSTLCSFARTTQGTGTRARFGLLPSNGVNINNNFKWNSRAVQTVFPFNTNTEMTFDKNDLLYDRINCYKTYVTIDLFNYTATRPIEVFIFRIRFKDTKYYDASETSCSDINGIVDTVLNEMTTDSDGTKTAQNRFALERMIRAKKLPKGFKVKSCRKVLLGASLTGEQPYPSQGGQIPAKSYKKIKMRFGSRLWMRSGCTNATQMIGDHVLEEAYNKVDHIMMLALPHQGACLEESQSNLTETLSLGFKISKTNIWKEHLN